MWLPLTVCKCQPRRVEVSEKISTNVIIDFMNSSKISARDSSPVKHQKHKSKKSKNCKCGTVPISRFITADSSGPYSSSLQVPIRRRLVHFMQYDATPILRQHIHLLLWYSRSRIPERTLDVSHDLLCSGHQWTAGAAKF
jgi:hypothetical protein